MAVLIFSSFFSRTDCNINEKRKNLNESDGVGLAPPGLEESMYPPHFDRYLSVLISPPIFLNKFEF